MLLISRKKPLEILYDNIIIHLSKSSETAIHLFFTGKLYNKKYQHVYMTFSKKKQTFDFALKMKTASDRIAVCRDKKSLNNGGIL
jgi:hypothetical protein